MRRGIRIHFHARHSTPLDCRSARIPAMNRLPDSSGDLNPYDPPRTKCEATIPPPGIDGFRLFRVHFLPLWLLFFLIAVVSSVVVAADVFSDGEGTLSYNALLAVLAASSFVGVNTALAYALRQILRVYVSEHGLRCGNFWGRHHFVAWTDVTGVRPINFLGLRYFRIYGRGLRWPLWLPRFMANPKVFWPFPLTLIESSSSLAQAIRDAGLASLPPAESR